MQCGSSRFLAATVRTPTGLILGAVVLAVGVAFSTPAFFGAIFATVSESERGAAAGTASAFIDLGLGGGPILLGVVADAQGIAWATGAGACFAVVGCAWTLALAQRRRDLSAA